MAEKRVKREQNKDLRKDIIARAMVDPSFRRKLYKSPEEIFGSELSETDLVGLELIKKFIPALDDIITNLAGEVLCGGGGCGGLA